MPRIWLLLALLLLAAGCALPRQRATARNADPALAARDPLAETVKTPAALEQDDQSSLAEDGRSQGANRAEAAGLKVLPVRFNDSSDRDSSDSRSTRQIDADSSSESIVLDPRTEYPLDLSTVLALVAGQNAQVQFAQWRIREAYAQLDGAEVLWLPSIQAGITYHRHDGTYQASSGEIVDVNRSSLQAGFGAGATGAGTVPVPGLVARFHATDAIFAPRIAERTAWARGHGAKATLNDELLNAALAYLAMLDASQQQAISHETLTHTLDLAELTNDFAETGQGLQADADRMAAELAVRRNDLLRADEALAVASVRLAEIASFDFASRLVPVEPTVVPIELVPLDTNRRGLITIGLSNRPELEEARCLVAEACERLKREKYAPLLPSVLLGLSYGGFGGGIRDQIGSMHDRADFDALAVWEVRNLGLGERAARETARTRIEQRRWEQVRLMDRVAREIAEAASQVESRRRQITVSEQAIDIARLSYERNLNRIRDGQGLPIEALQSIQALNIARREYLRAVVSFNEAQFRLHRALGWPVTG